MIFVVQPKTEASVLNEANIDNAVNKEFPIIQDLDLLSRLFLIFVDFSERDINFEIRCGRYQCQAFRN